MIRYETTQSKNEIARYIVERLRRFFSGHEMDIVLGINTDGEASYWHKVIGTEDMLVQITDSSDEGLWGDGDPDTPEYWEEHSDYLVKWFQESLIDEAIEKHNEYAREWGESEIEITFAQTT